MSDINSLALILLAEACFILLTTLLILVWLQIKSQKKRRSAVEQLVSQIKVRSKTRIEETEVFLQQVYDLNGAKLSASSKMLELQERLFLQKVIDILISSDVEKITSLDKSIIVLIDAYKNLKPTEIDLATKAGTENSANDLEALRAENATLNEELKTLREKMTGVLSEFGDMFGGFKSDSPNSSSNADKVVTVNDTTQGQDSLNATTEIDHNEIKSDEVK